MVGLGSRSCNVSVVARDDDCLSMADEVLGGCGKIEGGRTKI